MSFNSFSEFLAMDGHGLYVWLSYAIALGVVFINVVSPMQARKKLLATLVRRLRREGSNG